MDASKLLKRYAAGERGFPGADLCQADLCQADLSGADLCQADLCQADLSKANLSEAHLREANLIHANLSRADLTNANLIEANLACARLEKANLPYAYLEEATLLCSCLGEANLSHAYMEKANLSRAYMEKANLSHAYMGKANLSDANLSGANLSKANLSGANLSDANLTGANLFETDLTNSNLSGAKLDGTILAYQRINRELQQENLDLTKRIESFETQIENLIERQVEKRLITNQGITAKKALTWNRLRFRSEAERELAKVLDEMEIMFFPNTSGRVMSEEGMTTREVDFLICFRGKWGILECDNEIIHLMNSIKKGKVPSAASDHKRDNDFNRHGQWFIKRFTEEECKKNPRQVVRQFLAMLHKFQEDQRYLVIGDSTVTVTDNSP